jgi:hypothetical protein
VVTLDQAGERVPVAVLVPQDAKDKTVVWLDERGSQALFDGDGRPIAAVKTLLEAGIPVVGVDLLHQGDDAASADAQSRPAIKHSRSYAGFTYGYNYPLFVKRVHDVLTTIAAVRDRRGQDARVHLVGFGPAAAWAAAAAAQAGEIVSGLSIDNSFRFADIENLDSPHLLPGAVKYGDVESLLALAKSESMTVFGDIEESGSATAAASLRGGKTRIDTRKRQAIDAMAREAAEAIAKH